VTLQRELESGDTKVESGKVKLESGKYIHIIYLQPYTPGICKEILSNALVISFEQGAGRNLNFGTNGSGFYQILATEWENSLGKVFYDNNYYYIQSKGSNVKLKVQKSVLNKIDIEKRTMKGIHINEKY
jgi:hypothetical protein